MPYRKLVHLDVNKLLNGECPDKTLPIQYCLWKHHHERAHPMDLAIQVSSNYHTVRDWLIKYNLYFPVKRGLATPGLRDKVKEISQTTTNYTEIGRILGVDPGLIAQIAKEQGWAHNRRIKLPKLNISSILKGEKPKKATYKGRATNECIKYTIWLHCKEKLTARAIGLKIGTNTSVTRHWLKHYGVYTTNLKPNYSKTPMIHDEKFKARVLYLAEKYQGNLSKIGKKLGCSYIPLVAIGKEQGWYRKTIRKFKWVDLPADYQNTVDDMYLYRNLVRSATIAILRRYRNLIKGQENYGKPGYEVDHCLTIQEAFSRGQRPLPWQLVCHPANLQVLTTYQNRFKGPCSDFGPKSLLRRIEQFNREHGTILLPVETTRYLRFRKRRNNRRE